MRRAGLLFGAGLLVGAMAMYFVRGDDAGVTTPAVTFASNDAPSPSATGSNAPPRAIDFLELVAGSVDVTERTALYQFAAKADRATIVSLASQVNALPKIASRALALEVLLTRYAELDAPAAAALARELELEAAVAAPLFAVWAQRDSNAALRTLGDFDAPTAMTIGVALLETLGNDDLGIARVLGAAPQIDPDRFRVEAAIAKAATDPEAAVEDALRLPASKSANALTAIATAWAKDDVLGALAHVDYIDDNDRRNAFKGAVLRQWALDDPEALLAYVLDLSADEQDEAMRSGTLYAPLSALEPLRALEAAEALAGAAAAMVRRTALMQLAADDPLGALRHVESLPLGAERQQVLSSIATTYGRLDPEAAIAWAQSQNAPELLSSVLTGVARVNRRSRNGFAVQHSRRRSATGPADARDGGQLARRADGSDRRSLARTAEPRTGSADADQQVGATHARGGAALAAREQPLGGELDQPSRHEPRANRSRRSDRLSRPRTERAARHVGSAPSPKAMRRTTRAPRRAG